MVGSRPNPARSLFEGRFGPDGRAGARAADPLTAETEAEIYAEALRSQPLNTKYRIRSTSALERLGRPLDALSVLNAGLALTPVAAELLIEKIALLRRAGHLDAAAAAINALARQQPDNPKLASSRAELASASGDHAAAAAIYDESLRRRPLDTVAASA